MSEDIAVSPQAMALVKTGVLEVQKGKISLADLFSTLLLGSEPSQVERTPPTPKALTEAQKEALERLPNVYGKVVVTADRALTNKELQALVEEREVIDTILTVLEKRKSESIREVLSNHLDNILDEEQREGARQDRKGHYAVKQEVPVQGTGKKVQRLVSGGKPKLTIEQIEDLHASGKIDRKTYLAITKKPETPRVLDEDGLHRAIQKDPRLFFLLGSVAEPTPPTTTIKVVRDS